MATASSRGLFPYLNRAFSAIKQNPSYAIIPSLVIIGVAYHFKRNHSRLLARKPLGKPPHDKHDGPSGGYQQGPQQDEPQQHEQVIPSSAIDIMPPSLRAMLDGGGEFISIDVSTTSKVYRGVKVLSRPHPKASQLPNDLPMVVFLHDDARSFDNIEGNPSDQFGNLASRLWDSASCLFIDLPQDSHLSELVVAIIESHYDDGNHGGIVFISFGSGCELACRTANALMLGRLKGLIQLCPRFSQIDYVENEKHPTLGNPNEDVPSRPAEDVSTVRTPDPGDCWRRCNETGSGSKIDVPTLVVSEVIHEDTINVPPGVFRTNTYHTLKTPLTKFRTSLHRNHHCTLLYVPTAYKTVSAIIRNFLSDEVNAHLSRGWQMQQTSKPQESKWNAKSFKKWRETQSVSEPIAGIFWAMKTMRDDDYHCPQNFVQKWAGTNHIAGLLDISSTNPPYTPGDLQGLTYSKFPSESKYVPTEKEVRMFIQRVRDIQASTRESGASIICVHCHYGYNRTGFFIIAYLVEQEGWKVEDAIREFSTQRPPGLKHQWFEDELYLRYSKTP